MAKLLLLINHSDSSPTDVVRAMMLLRCNALSRGNSGIRLSTLESLLTMLGEGKAEYKGGVCLERLV